MDRWECHDLCSLDYINRWQALLQLPPGGIGRQDLRGSGHWGAALWQNSPWTHRLEGD